jgi:hypothetical protein
MLFKEMLFLYNTEKVYGQIINYETHVDDDGDIFHTPIYKFKTKQGQQIIQSSNISFKYKNLEKDIPIRYKKNNPKHCQIDMLIHSFLPPIIFAILGICVIIISRKRTQPNKGTNELRH